MYTLNQTIEAIIRDKSWKNPDEKPNKHTIVIVRCKVGEYYAYEVCKYIKSTNNWQVQYANSSVGCLYQNTCKIDGWTVITRQEAVKIWGIDYYKIHMYERRDIYDDYRRYLSDFLEERAVCSPEDNVYAVPYSFVEWMKSENIDVESVIGEE